MNFHASFPRNFRTDYEIRSDLILSKRILSLLLAAAVIMSLSAVAAAVETDSQPAQEAQPAELPAETVQEQDAASEADAEVEEPLPPAPLYVNQQPVYTELYWLKGTAYVAVRPFFEKALPGCEVKWENRQAVITGTTANGESLTVTAKPGECYIRANDRYLYAWDGIPLINSATMIPISLLARIFNAYVVIDEQGAIQVSLGRKILDPANYDPATVDIFSRLIFSESGNQSMLGKLAVGSVVMNRVNSPLFPNTIYDVIHQPGQFSVVDDGNIHLIPSEEAVIAAKLCLEGANVTKALFFNVRGLQCWAAYYRPYITTIGDHDFYA